MVSIPSRAIERITSQTYINMHTVCRTSIEISYPGVPTAITNATVPNAATAYFGHRRPPSGV